VIRRRASRSPVDDAIHLQTTRTFGTRYERMVWLSA